MLRDRLKGILFNINFGFLLFAVIVVYLLFLIKNDIVKSENLKREERSISIQIKEQGDLKKELSRKLKLLNQDSYVEKLAREKLGLVKQGERAYKVVKP